MILCIGDSYASDSRDHAYSKIVANLLGKQISINGYPGHSFWHVRRNLFEILKKIDKSEIEVVIIVHPHYIRIPNKTDLPINFGSIENLMNVNRLSLTMAETVVNYCDFFYDRDNNLWQLKNWIREVNSEIFDPKTYIINLHGTSNSYLEIPLYYGPNSCHVINSLFAIQRCEFSSEKEYYDYLGPNGNDARANHFSVHNNKVIGDELYHLITNNITGSYTIDYDKFEIKDIHMFYGYHKDTGHR